MFVNNIRINFWYPFYFFFYKNISLTFNFSAFDEISEKIFRFFFIINFIVTDKKYFFFSVFNGQFFRNMSLFILYKVLIKISVQVLSSAFQCKDYF